MPGKKNRASLSANHKKNLTQKLNRAINKKNKTKQARGLIEHRILITMSKKNQVVANDQNSKLLKHVC